MKQKPKVIVILGPTASGKSDLAVKLAKDFNGEVISADSRQVYKGLNIGTGKITKREMQGVPHHLLNIADPKKQYTVVDFKRDAEKVITDILKKHKLPIICGGTGFYIKALVDNISLPEVPPNFALRKRLKSKSASELFLMLQELDPKRARNIDAKNPIRLIRAIEIAKALGKVPQLKSKPQSKYNFLQIGIKIPDQELKQRIHQRLLKRLESGMITEAKKLHVQGLSWKRMEELGLEYRYLAKFLQKEISRQELVDKLNSEIWQYAKRQKTWFKKDKRIEWVSL